ncbi:AT-rich interactive domain-containing protein 2 [Dorcoceras hygrometricum]|uniref:AT-rich interactive domain-containing protein 2 n=1 Tax=Dorcoceras hygrometricum TaxID=472368 RepID=A0A2Z7ARC8_9LAMI|nr:AT-rich interactive domain-containing protein 2 [Dorcoceras hygrometricum]
MEGWMELEGGVGNGKEKFEADSDTEIPVEECRFDPSKESLRGLFDQVLLISCKFLVVRKVGGYNAVSRNNLWDFVSEECGLGSEVIPSIESIYVKYLKEFDQWLRPGFSDRSLENGNVELVRKSDALSRELETRFQVVLDRQEGKEKDNKLVDCTKDMNKLNTSETTCLFSPIGEINEQMNNQNCLLNDNDEKLRFNCDSDVTVSSERISNESIEICGDEEESVNDDIKKFYKDDDFAVLANGVFRKAANEVNEFSEGLLVGKGKSYAKDCASVMASTEKIIENAVAGRVVEKVNKAHNLPENIADDGEMFIPQNVIVENTLNSLKRKREHRSLSKMLDWLKCIAKKSDDPEIGVLPMCSKWKDHGKEELWVQVLLVRKTLMIRRPADANAREHLKDKHKKPRMHPSMYEDHVSNLQQVEKLRYSERVPSSARPNLCPCCNLEAAQQSISHHKAKTSGCLKAPPVKPVSANVKEPAINLSDHEFSDVPVPPEKQVSVGPLFQAEVPAWAGERLESDSKWLGTRMWPQENGEKKSIGELDPIGKGRLDSCSCSFPHSVECVRFHIAEKRFKLRRDIGLLFYHWRFDRMGEEVSLSWTREEEIRFRDMMRSYSAYTNKFWNNSHRFLPSKTRENLVSYYFNVFLVQRRSYQNRVIPKEIDSDDDEKECGFIGDSFGYKALTTPGSRRDHGFGFRIVSKITDPPGLPNTLIL